MESPPLVSNPLRIKTRDVTFRRFGAPASTSHSGALSCRCLLVWMLLVQQLVEGIICFTMLLKSLSSFSLQVVLSNIVRAFASTCSRVCFTLSMSLVREASTEKISRICCWASISGLRGPPSLISTLIGGFEGSISYCFICI